MLSPNFAIYNNGQFKLYFCPLRTKRIILL
nr:MAG TPA: hypothetical protein [Bacteriophage sp.]